MIEWNSVASALGYTGEVEMWKDLYTTRRLSISQLSRKLDVGRNTIRASLGKSGIVLRKRGGPNNQRLVVTDELVEEVRKDGVAAVAKRLKLDYTTLYKRIYRVRGLTVKSLRTGSETMAASPSSDGSREIV